MAKSMWTDFFKGEPSDKVDVEGLRYLVSLSVEEEGLAGAKPPMRLRVYTIRTRRSGQRLPRVEVDEIGPRMDFRVGRMQQPEEAMLKEAMRRPKTTEERTKKNIKTDEIGDKVGRVHTGRQDLSQLQTRRMKGLKRSRDVADDDAASDDEVKTDKRKKN
ncbi:Ribosome biogenesis protein RPF2 like [Verticillium longisporum]|nr:Ribosome biogenesis protein RPF2 like [Verticillium longisporum]